MNNCNRELLKVQDVEKEMERHDGLVHAFIRRRGSGSISYEEALQAGRIGLWRAIKGYDPTRGTAFSTYAWVAIRNQIRRREEEVKREKNIYRGEIPSSRCVLSPDEVVERELVREALFQMVERLPERFERVIIGRYGLGEHPPRTLKQLGDELGVSGERVRQIQQEALAWLRHPVHSLHLRQLLGKNTAADYRRALRENTALRRKRRKEK